MTDPNEYIREHFAKLHPETTVTVDNMFDNPEESDDMISVVCLGQDPTADPVAAYTMIVTSDDDGYRFTDDFNQHADPVCFPFPEDY